MRVFQVKIYYKRTRVINQAEKSFIDDFQNDITYNVLAVNDVDAKANALDIFSKYGEILGNDVDAEVLGLRIKYCEINCICNIDEKIH